MAKQEKNVLEIDEKIRIVITELLNNSKLAAEGGPFLINIDEIRERSQLSSEQFHNFLFGVLYFEYDALNFPDLNENNFHNKFKSGLLKTKINYRQLNNYLSQEQYFVRIDHSHTGLEDDENFKEKYLSEKSKGGKASGNKYKDLRKKVEELCKEELKKDGFNASTLCEAVSYIMEKYHPELLENFKPYQIHSEDGGGWTKGSFYNWCNTTFKEFKI